MSSFVKAFTTLRTRLRPTRLAFIRLSTTLLIIACGGGSPTGSPTSVTPPITTTPTDSTRTPPPSYFPGVSYFGRSSYIEYIAGNHQHVDVFCLN